jgi:hypothetical protein
MQEFLGAIFLIPAFYFFLCIPAATILIGPWWFCRRNQFAYATELFA